MVHREIDPKIRVIFNVYVILYLNLISASKTIQNFLMENFYSNII